jgi:hypothetical protein
VLTLGGALVQEPAAAAQGVLEVDATVFDDPGTKLALYDLQRRLALGKITPAAFCEQVVINTQAAVSPQALYEALPLNASLVPGMLSFLNEVSGAFELRLISDYPEPWLSTLLRHTGLSDYFAPVAAFVLADHGLPDEVEAWLDLLLAEGILAPGTSLWIDGNSLRTRAAIRRGIDALIAVSAWRTMREMTLYRRLLPQTQA